MYILLTDVLTCPRCGPEFGLIVLAERMEARRVMEGHLGCANCRTHYPIRGAVSDLRLDPSAAPPPSTDPPPRYDEPADAETAMRLAALMGLAGASGMAVIAGPGARLAGAASSMVPELEVIAVDDAPGAEAEPGVSRVVVDGARLPFRGGLRGAALTGGVDAERLREGLRVLTPGARLVVDPASADTARALRGMGAEVLLEEEGVVVAQAPGRPVALRINAVR
jgi:uncharacterized protein YbaR (Trm112 family)